MSGPGRDAVRRGLYDANEYAHAADTIQRINICHERRLDQISLRGAGDAVLAAQLVLDLVETAVPAVLRAMVVQLTTPELRPAVPVVVANVPVGSVNPSTEKVGGLATPTPPAPARVQLYKAVRPPIRELYCVDSGRAVKVEGDRCLTHGGAGVMCKTAARAPRCTHQVVSPNHAGRRCSECGVDLVLVTAEELEQQYGDSAGFGEEL